MQTSLLVIKTLTLQSTECHEVLGACRSPAMQPPAATVSRIPGVNEGKNESGFLSSTWCRSPIIPYIE